MEASTAERKIRAERGLLAVFPNIGMLQQFAMEVGADKKGDKLASFLSFAYRNGIIEEAKLEMLEDFIIANSRQPSEKQGIFNGIDLVGFLAERGRFLNYNDSESSLIQNINNTIGKCGLKLASISGNRFTRLKEIHSVETVGQRDALRAIAFYISYTRPDLVHAPDFSDLLRMIANADHHHLATNNKKPAVLSEGTRILFRLRSPEDEKDLETVQWLAEQLQSSIDLFDRKQGAGISRTVRRYGTASFYVDCPRTDSGNEYFGHPSAFCACVRDAINIALQMVILWNLSKLKIASKSLAVIIATGKYGDDLNKKLHKLLQDERLGGPEILVTEFKQKRERSVVP